MLSHHANMVTWHYIQIGIIVQIRQPLADGQAQPHPYISLYMSLVKTAARTSNTNYRYVTLECNKISLNVKQYTDEQIRTRIIRITNEGSITEVRIQPRPVDSLTPSCRKFEIWFRRVESFSFLNFWMLKSCRNFERSERSKVWKLGAFETVDF